MVWSKGPMGEKDTSEHACLIYMLWLAPGRDDLINMESRKKERGCTLTERENAQPQQPPRLSTYSSLAANEPHNNTKAVLVFTAKTVKLIAIHRTDDKTMKHYSPLSVYGKHQTAVTNQHDYLFMLFNVAAMLIHNLNLED